MTNDLGDFDDDEQAAPKRTREEMLSFGVGMTRQQIENVERTNMWVGFRDVALDTMTYDGESLFNKYSKEGAAKLLAGVEVIDICMQEIARLQTMGIAARSRLLTVYSVMLDQERVTKH